MESPKSPLRRRMLTAAVLAPVLAGAGTAAGLVRPAPAGARRTQERFHPVMTTTADWRGVERTLGRRGDLAGTEYRVGFPRGDLNVKSYGVSVTSALAVASHVAFVRYADASTLMMGDLVVTEAELQRVIGALGRHGIRQTAIHKHLLAQSPPLWWIHIHGHGRDAAALAGGLRAALEHTATPPASAAPAATLPARLDGAGIDAALGVKGVWDQGIYRCLFVRRETVEEGDYVLPPGLGATTAFLFQPLGRGRAAVNGDYAMTAGEVQEVLAALERGGIKVVELHNHGLTDEPRLFFTHLWAVGDAVRIARALRTALDVTNVRPFDAPQTPRGAAPGTAPGVS
jgi:Domain of Unknown Function (DUF1259)